MSLRCQKVVSLFKNYTVKENTVQNSRSERDVKYNQYRIDQLEKAVEGVIQHSYFHRWEYSFQSLKGEK